MILWKRETNKKIVSARIGALLGTFFTFTLIVATLSQPDCYKADENVKVMIRNATPRGTNVSLVFGLFDLKTYSKALYNSCAIFAACSGDKLSRTSFFTAVPIAHS